IGRAGDDGRVGFLLKDSCQCLHVSRYDQSVFAIRNADGAARLHRPEPGYEPIVKAAEQVSMMRPSTLLDPLQRTRSEIVAR
ncbi:hypothetical protein ACC676_39280, partial [Rhizobium ruizarguesonis]